MKIEIFILETGKQQSFYKKAIDEYAKRLSRYCKIEHKIIRKEKEWIKFLEQGKEGYVIKSGKSVDSETFSEMIRGWELSGKKSICFYIMKEEECGDWMKRYPNCLSESFSLSNYQMTNMMEALILYEQIYRGYRIMNNHPYHK